MILKKHIAQGRLMIVVCDSDLIGKKFEENDLQLNLDSNFYKGEEVPDEKILEVFEGAYIIHLVGEKAVKLGLKAGVVSEVNIVRIKGIPHAESVRG